MSTKLTPGSLTVRQRPNYGGGYYIDHAELGTVAELLPLSAGPELCADFSRLFSAAPDIYEALEKAANMLRPFIRKMKIRDNFAEINAFENTIMAALRKARGE